MSDYPTDAQRRAWNNDGMDPNWRPAPSKPTLESQLATKDAEIERLKEKLALADAGLIEQQLEIAGFKAEVASLNRMFDKLHDEWFELCKEVDSLKSEVAIARERLGPAGYKILKDFREQKLEIAHLKTLVQQYEREDDHEAMSCYVSHQRLEKVEADLKVAVNLLNAIVLTTNAPNPTNPNQWMVAPGCFLAFAAAIKEAREALAKIGEREK